MYSYNIMYKLIQNIAEWFKKQFDKNSYLTILLMPLAAFIGIFVCIWENITGGLEPMNKWIVYYQVEAMKGRRLYYARFCNTSKEAGKEVYKLMKSSVNERGESIIQDSISIGEGNK